MIIILIRTLILYIIVLIAIRLMGKSELSKMDPFQMVILFMIAELAAIPIESPAVSLLSGATAIFTLLFLQVVISLISLKSEKLKNLFNGKPSMLINKGVIDKKEMKSLRISIDDLTEQLRLKNAPSIADVDYAILEANGDLSVIPKPNKRPLTPEDLNIIKPEENIPLVIISDGILYRKNLIVLGFDENYLKSELLKYNITDYKQVFLCLCDETKKFHIYKNSKSLNKESLSSNRG
ncbi:DUF421 domain-containing protein [Anaerovorax odorimutans]|uniref:DUF421 domain-containing protein n=1 Tax=Anaerovorax odorimutans TaxID=109327 RepID=UPI00040D21E8|nr:DUF421 domain-containing protein [Anaerovorax odorimutans]